MKHSRQLLLAGLTLCLSAPVFANPPDREKATPEGEQTQRLEFKKPDKVIIQATPTASQQMNKKEMAEKLAKKADMSPDEGEGKAVGHELTHTVQQKTKPRETSSGMATGKRQHKPIVLTKEVDKAGMNKGEIISEIASKPARLMSFNDAIAACRSEADLQACIDMKTDQNRTSENENTKTTSSTINSNPKKCNPLKQQGICKKN